MFIILGIISLKMEPYVFGKFKTENIIKKMATIGI